MNKDCFTPKVLEADCDNTPITFLTEEIEGVDDIANPPQNGAHRNLIVKYLMTGHIYLYNSAGIPILLNESSVVDAELSLDSINPVQNKVITKALNNETEARETKDNELQQSVENVSDSLSAALETETTNRENADTALQQQIENIDNSLSEALDNKVDKVTGKGLSTNDYTNADKETVDSLEGKLDQDVVNAIQISSNTSTDVLVLEDGKVNLWTGATNTHEVPLPVASSTSAGVMNSATYNSIVNNSNNIINILQGTVAITGLSATPTQEELTTQWKAASGETELINGARIYDVTNHVNWTYYSNANEWLSVGAGGESISVNQWTNNAAGIIKGSTEPGQLFAEADGTGSVNGWDTVKSDIANNASDISTLNTTVAGQTSDINSLNTQVATNTTDITNLTTDVETNTSDIASLNTAVSGKQDTLVSGTNIKTINGSSILGSGNLKVKGDTSEVTATIAYTTQTGGLARIDTITLPLTTFVMGEEINFIFNVAGGYSFYIYQNTKIHIGSREYSLLVSAPYQGSSGLTSYHSAAEIIKENIFIDAATTYHMRLIESDQSGYVGVLTGIQNAMSQNVYSTTEQVVGTWIDGEPIYRKVYIFSITTTNSEVSIDISDTNIAGVINLTGGMFTSGNEYYPVQYSNPAAPNIQSFQVKSNYGKNQLNYYAGATGVGRIILEYIKNS